MQAETAKQNKREGSETLVMHQSLPKQARLTPRKDVCTCGKYNSRKHQCPIHYSASSRLLFAGETYGLPYNPKSQYEDTFKPIPRPGDRGGFKVPVRALPVIPKGKTDLVSVDRSDFVSPPVDYGPKNVTPEEKEDKADAASCEAPHKPLLQGKFPDVVAQGTPNAHSKNVETTHLSDAKFEGSSPSKAAYSLPSIVIEENMPVYTKRCSKKNRETMRKLSGKIEKMTKYMSDHPRYETFPPKRKMCTPEPDTLQLFSRGKVDSIASEQQANYGKWEEQPKPSTPFFKAKYEAPSSKFEGFTSNMDHFKPVGVKQHVAEITEVNRTAAEIGCSQKNGKGIKEAQHFGGQFTASTTNKSEYFPYEQTTPRVRYDFSYEKLYRPPSTKFSAQSESKRHYIPLDAKPAKSFKLRYPSFKLSDQPQIIRSTAYREEFPIRPLPRRDVYPSSQTASLNEQ